MLRFAGGALLAAILMFAWGYVFWATPLSESAFRQAPDNQKLAQVLKQTIPATGTYLVPDGEPTSDAHIERYKRGPIATVFYREAGTNPMRPSTFLLGLVHMFVTTLCIGGALWLAKGALPSYLGRVGFVGLIGLAVAIWANLGDPIWWHRPWEYQIYTAVYDAVAWLLAGLVLAAFVRQRQRQRRRTFDRS